MAPTSTDGGPPTTILVIDDDPDTRGALAEILFFSGYVVVLAGDGAEAFDMLHAGLRPALIVLDLVMPRMDGWTFLSRLRVVEHSTLPVLVTSASTCGEVPAGADVCVEKPVDVAAFAAAVASMCDRQPSAPSP